MQSYSKSAAGNVTGIGWLFPSSLCWSSFLLLQPETDTKIVLLLPDYYQSSSWALQTSVQPDTQSGCLHPLSNCTPTLGCADAWLSDEYFSANLQLNTVQSSANYKELLFHWCQVSSGHRAKFYTSRQLSSLWRSKAVRKGQEHSFCKYVLSCCKEGFGDTHFKFLFQNQPIISIKSNQSVF